LESEDNEEDFPVLEADVLGSLFEEDIEDSRLKMFLPLMSLLSQI
jgi:hypothetical protein